MKPLVKHERIRRGKGGAYDIAYIIAREIEAGRVHPDVLKKAAELLRGIDWRDRRAVVHALWKFVRDDVDYRKDPYGQELVRYPETVLEHMAGDCDDQTVLLGALLSAVDAAPISLVLARANPATPAFTHILLAAEVEPGKVMPLETIEPEIPFGVLPKQVRSYELVPLRFTGAKKLRGARLGETIYTGPGVGGLGISFKERVKRAARKVRKQAKRTGRQIERPLRPSQYVKVNGWRVRVTPKGMLLPILGPGAVLLPGGKTEAVFKKGKRLQREKIAPVIGFEPLPTTVRGHLRRGAVLAPFLPGGAVIAPALKTASQLAEERARKRKGAPPPARYGVSPGARPVGYERVPRGAAPLPPWLMPTLIGAGGLVLLLALR